MGAKNKAVTVGYWYSMGLHFGIAHGPVDALQRIEVGDREAWTGNITDNTTTAIDAPELFGGEKREGGIQGALTVLMGAPAQAVDPYLADKLGAPTPAFRGILSAVFNGRVAALNPYVKPWAFKVKRILQGWSGGTAWNAAKADIDGDMNPAHILYQCLTDASWGMGYPASVIDEASFAAAADALYTEGFGLSILWNRQATINEFLQIILDHIGAILYVRQDTGRFAIKLIRDDYVKASLDQYGPSNLVSVLDYQRRGWGEGVNEIVVIYTDRATGKETAVAVQDLAAVATQGQVVSQSARYPGITSPALAQRVALRDLRNVSLPISRARITANRRAWDIIPGDVLRLTWPPYGIDDVVFRVMQVNRGTLNDGQISIDVVEDVFALPTNTYTQEQPPLWVSPNTEPADITLRRLIETPYWDLARTLSEADLDYLDPDAGYLQAVAASNAPDALGYSLAVSPDGSAYDEIASGDAVPTGTTTAALVPELTTSTTIGALQDASDVSVGGYALLGPEVVQVTAFNATSGAITLSRGILDTVPVAHPIGTRIWFADGLQAADPTEYAATETVYAKLLARTTLGQLPLAAATPSTLQMQARQSRPYPPGNFRLDGQRWPATITGDGSLQIDWAGRNRLTQTATLIAQDAGNITPEPGTTFSIEVRNLDTDTVIDSQTGLTGQTYTATMPTGTYNVGVQLWAVRDGRESWQRQSAAFLYDYP